MSSVIFCTSVFLLTIVSIRILFTVCLHDILVFPKGVTIERNQIVLENSIVQPYDATSGVPSMLLWNRNDECFRQSFTVVDPLRLGQSKQKLQNIDEDGCADKVTEGVGFGIRKR